MTPELRLECIKIAQEILTEKYDSERQAKLEMWRALASQNGIKKPPPIPSLPYFSVEQMVDAADTIMNFVMNKRITK